MVDRYASLPVVGWGPTFYTCEASRRWLLRLWALSPGDEVDVLLDDGRVVRTALTSMSGAAPTARCVVWVQGIVGSYATGRVRPADRWWRTRGFEKSIAESTGP